MTSLRFYPGSTSKTLNLSLLRFNERSGSKNLDVYQQKIKFRVKENIKNIYIYIYTQLFTTK